MKAKAYSVQTASLEVSLIFINLCFNEKQDNFESSLLHSWSNMQLLNNLFFFWK